KVWGFKSLLVHRAPKARLCPRRTQAFASLFELSSRFKSLLVHRAPKARLCPRRTQAFASLFELSSRFKSLLVHRAPKARCSPRAPQCKRFHHDDVLGGCERERDRFDFLLHSSLNNLALEGQHAEAEVDLDCRWFVNQQEHAGCLREI